MNNVNEKVTLPATDQTTNDKQIISGCDYFKKNWLKLALLVSGLIFCYSTVMLELVKVWSEDKSYSHGFMVIPISLYLAWLKKEKLNTLQIIPNYIGGILIMILAGGMLIIGKIGGVSLLQDISLIIMISGIVLLLMGPEYLKNLSLPISYLLFMVPLLDVAPGKINWPLQIFSANLGVFLLKLFGYTVYLENQFIELPHMTLEVAQECSGLRFIMSIIAIGIPLSYLTQKGWLRRVSLIAIAIIIAILSNGLRVMLVGILAYNGSTDIHGPSHIFQGMVIAWVGFIALFAGAWVFSRFPSKYIEPSDNEAKLKKQFKLVTNSQINISWIMAISILLVISLLIYFYNPVPEKLEGDYNELLFSQNDWVSRELPAETHPIKILGADREIDILYTVKGGQEINLYVGYFDYQQQGKEIINDISEKYHDNSELINIVTKSDELLVNKSIIKEKNHNYLVLFWYKINGRNVHNRYIAKLWTIYDAIIHNRSNGAIIIFSTPILNNQPIDEKLEYQKNLISSISPKLDKFLSNKKIQ